MRIWINKGKIENQNSLFEDAIVFDMLDENPKSNLKVDFEQLWNRFGLKCLSEICEDLIVIAASVYAVDKRVPRSDSIIKESADNWTRNLNVSVPVLEYEKWKAVKNEFEALLNFLSGDVWNLDFRKTEIKYEGNLARRKCEILEAEFEAVSLFSGGLDSFSGAIRLLENGKSICFVGCREYYALARRIDELIQILREEYPNKIEGIVFKADPGIPRKINENLRSRYTENTSRSRSLLFLSVAVAVASIVGNNIPVYIPENGFIGLNLPLTPNRIGSCSTRTTHVHFIKLFNKILSSIGIGHCIENPFAYKSKGEIIKDVKDTKAFKRGAGKTISCSHPMRGDKGIPGRPRNCGYCYPCLIRRASLNGINVNEDYFEDFKEEYKIGMQFITNEKYTKTEKTADLKAVCFSLHNYIRQGSIEYYTERIITLGGMDLEEIGKFVRVYMKTMEEIYQFMKDQAVLNGKDLLEYIGAAEDE